MKNKPILIISGDVESIFFEIFFKALKEKKYKSPIILITNLKLLEHEMKFFNFNRRLNILSLKNVSNTKLDNNSLNVINIKLDNSFQKKKVNDYLDISFNTAFKIIKSGLTYKLINGPINKKNFLRKNFLGITEYISNKYNKKKIGMLIYNKKLSVCPVTTHLPLKNVINSINKNIIKEKIKLVNDFYLKYLNLKPRIAVTGLNPHCESILEFNEDEKILKPVVKFMKKRNINVNGPFPADTIFSSKNIRLYDVIIGMYHDQVLAPIKALYEFDAINVTMGLPFLRATPDHGPNKEMVGKNLSNPTSLIRALEFLDNK